MALYKAACYIAMKRPDTGTSVSHTSASTVLMSPWKFVDDILADVLAFPCSSCIVAILRGQFSHRCKQYTLHFRQQRVKFRRRKSPPGNFKQMITVFQLSWENLSFFQGHLSREIVYRKRWNDPPCQCRTWCTYIEMVNILIDENFATCIYKKI